MMDVCSQCEREFERIGRHWSMSPSCSYPTLSDSEIEIAKGMLLGDGGLNPDGYLYANMTTKPFLEWIDNQFGLNGCGVKLRSTAEESAKEAKESDFITTVNEENYHDVYRWTSRCVPEIQELKSWYKTGEKKFPEELSLTPLMAKVWYCGDGNYSNTDNRRGRKPYARIASNNESHRPKFLKGLFQEHGFDPYINDNYLTFTTEETSKFLSWMGDPLPGFEYKWGQ